MLVALRFILIASEFIFLNPSSHVRMPHTLFESDSPVMSKPFK